MAQPPRPTEPPRFEPPREVEVPKNQATNLENKLNMVITEIDKLQYDIARGEPSSTMMSWNDLTSRYTILLGRLADLTSEVNRTDTRSKPGFTPLPGPITSHYLVHPLYAVPATEMDQLKYISTRPYPGSEGNGEETRTAATAGLLGAQLGRLDVAALERHVDSLKTRWEGENDRARSVLEDIREREGGYDWKLRVDTLEESGSEGGEGDGEEEEEDLFGDDEDEEMEKKEEEVKAPNPREGWTLADYLKLMDTGKTRPTAAA